MKRVSKMMICFILITFMMALFIQLARAQFYFQNNQTGLSWSQQLQLFGYQYTQGEANWTGRLFTNYNTPLTNPFNTKLPVTNSTTNWLSLLTPGLSLGQSSPWGQNSSFFSPWWYQTKIQTSDCGCSATKSSSGNNYIETLIGADYFGQYGLYQKLAFEQKFPLLSTHFYSLPFLAQKPAAPTPKKETMGLMLLIEFEGMDGLSNFVYELQKRDMPSLLIVSSGFVADNCEGVKKLQKYGVEVGGVYSQKAFWDVPYEEQFEVMKEAKETIEACTGKPMRVFGSRYFAYDENTLKAADALGIEYVLARGTTGAKATIYKPTEYNVKIFSVSNVSSEKWGTGSLCDYSYWAREGSAEEFGDELFTALEYSKISPVSHTYIGGLKAAWNAEYMNFFDNADVKWADLDTFGSVDITQSFSKIPQNREVQYTTPQPQVPLDQEPDVENPCSLNEFPPKSYTEGLMLLIEYENVAGLTNFVYELFQRGIPAVLRVDPAFAREHAGTLKMLQNYGVEIGASCSPVILWDIPYEEQYRIMKETVEAIEAAIGTPIRVFGSKYFAYDENTLKAADALGIEYVLARGTTGAKATIFKAEEYDAKILSVSNVGSESWGTGSLCDYSYWAREGSTEQFREELFNSALEYDKISPVTHTYIGGLKAAWFDVYMDFFDNAEVKWVNLDEFGTVDVTLPFSEIPDNREVQYTTPSPLIPLEEDPDLENLYTIDDFPPVRNVGDKIIIFHNGTGPMCIEVLAFLETIQYTIEEHLTTEANFWNTLESYKTLFGSSEGVSSTFGYFPIIFIQDRAFSGFNDTIRDEILGMI